MIKKACSRCEGDGSVLKTSKLEVKIPAGSETGTNLRVKGEGEAGERGAETGDLYVIIHVKEHKFFERHGDDIYIEVPVTFGHVALGDVIEVPTLKGDAELKIPAGTQSHTVFRMRGKGVKHLHGSGSGDQLVRVILKTPTKLTKHQKEIIKELEKEKKKFLF